MSSKIISLITELNEKSKEFLEGLRLLRTNEGFSVRALPFNKDDANFLAAYKWSVIVRAEGCLPYAASHDRDGEFVLLPHWYGNTVSITEERAVKFAKFVKGEIAKKKEVYAPSIIEIRETKAVVESYTNFKELREQIRALI